MFFTSTWRSLHRRRLKRAADRQELFCAVLGNGIQLFCMTVGVLALACLGIYSYSPTPPSLPGACSPIAHVVVLLYARTGYWREGFHPDWHVRPRLRGRHYNRGALLVAALLIFALT